MVFCYSRYATITYRCSYSPAYVSDGNYIVLNKIIIHRIHPLDCLIIAKKYLILVHTLKLLKQYFLSIEQKSIDCTASAKYSNYIFIPRKNFTSGIFSIAFRSSKNFSFFKVLLPRHKKNFSSSSSSVKGFFIFPFAKSILLL